jgi:hypothetical protein
VLCRKEELVKIVGFGRKATTVVTATHSIQPTGCELAEAGPRETGEKQDDISRSLTQFTEIAGSSRDLHPVAGLRQKKVAAEGVDQFPLG